jgi:glycosyltransferase involved in cell wall biosynthesis
MLRKRGHMKICLVSQEYPPETGGGGIGTQTFLKARGLSARGHEVHVVSASATPEARTYKDGDATVHRVPYPALAGLGSEQSTSWLALSFTFAQKVAELAQQVSFDIMQFPEYCGEGFIYQTDNFAYRTARYVVQLHGPLAMVAQHMGWPDVGSTIHRIGCFMERSVIHHSDLVLASSHNTARFCAKYYEYPLGDIGVVHSGIDTDRFSLAAAPADDRFPRILFVGNFVASKGFKLLIDAALELRQQFPRITLRMIGKGDPAYVSQIRRRLDEEGAVSSIELVGYVPYADLPRHYGWCDFFAGPSTFEPGPGNVYLEAMSCGKPVIACDSAGTPEVVLHEQTGLLVPPENSAALVQAIDRLARDEALRRQLGQAGRQRIEANFSIAKYLDKVEQHYTELLRR